MADMLQTGAAWLGTKLAAHASQSVNYTRKATTVVGLYSTPAEARWESDGEVVMIDWHGQDFIMTVSDLSAFDEPAQGDVITWDGEQYEVCSPSGFPCWRYSDRYQLRCRIHTKRISDP